MMQIKIAEHNLNNKFNKMFHKTEQSEASTNAEQKATSFFTSRERQMYKQHKKQNSPAPKQGSMSNATSNYNDLLMLTPTLINQVAWPVVYTFDGEITVGVKSSFYEIRGIRGKSRFVPRMAEAEAEVVYFYAERPGKKINMVSVERYLEAGRLWLHINIAKYDTNEGEFESSNFHLESGESSERGDGQLWDFVGMQTVDNLKKGIVLMKVISEGHTKNSYKILLLDLFQMRRNRDISELNQKTPAHVLCLTELDFQSTYGRQFQKIKKTIKSQFGDIVVMITNNEVYQLEIDDIGDVFKMNVKCSKVSRFLNMNNSKESSGGFSNQEEEIEDVRFMSNGLKLMALTSFGRIVVTEGVNFLNGQKVGEIIRGSSHNNVQDRYHIDSFVFTRIYPVNGTIAVQFHGKNGVNLLKNSSGEEGEKKEQLRKGLLILKVQDNVLSFAKIVNLQLDPKELVFLHLRQSEGLDELLVQSIQKKSPDTLQVYKCKILVQQLNMFTKVQEYEYNYSKVVNHGKQELSHYHPSDSQKLYTSTAMPKVSRLFYFLRDRELSCYKLFTDLDSQKTNRQMTHLFNHTFFEKPLKMTVNPVTMHFAIVFRQFVKFFHFDYSQFKNYHTIKLKNITQAKYIGRGQKIVICTSDGVVHLIDSYRFTEEIVMDFYGEILEMDLIEEKEIMVIRNNKNGLAVYGRNEEDEKREFVKNYEVKLEDGDLYHFDEKRLVVFRRKGAIEVYSHQQAKKAENTTEAEKQSYQKIHDMHCHMTQRVVCKSFGKDQVATSLLLAEELGFLIVGTNKGNLKEYLWPIQEPTNPNPPDVLTTQVSSHKILSLFLDAKLTNIYALSENSTVTQLQITQYINGEQMPFVYIFSQKTINQEMQKRQFADRSYFIDNFTPTETVISQSSEQYIEELEFFVDKLKDDLEEMTKNALAKGKVEEKGLKNRTRKEQVGFRDELQKEEDAYTAELNRAKQAADREEEACKKEKEEAIEEYQKTLLGLYKESDRLKNIMKTQDEKMTKERKAFVVEFQQKLKVLQKEKEAELIKLQSQYQAIEVQKERAQMQHRIYNEEQEAEMEQYKAKIHQQEQEELTYAEEHKERLLGDNAKREKEINNLKHRSNYFQNLILQTKVQIAELTKDQEEYEKKKHYLQDELKDKESIIERIERELVLYLKNTQDMKTIKNNHQFELDEYEQEVTPITENHKLLENNVRQMNEEIMNEYTDKVNKVQQIDQLNLKANALKDKKKETTFKKLHGDNRIVRMQERLVYLATHPFDCDLREELKSLLEEEASEESTKLNEHKEKQRRDREKLIRYKNMIRREIQEEEKREEHVVKNQHQFFKHHNENTTLLREFNELKKMQKYLLGQQSRLEQKVNAVKASFMHTPLRRVPSVNLHRHLEKKMTPFQRYEEEQSMVQRKQQDTSDTRLTRGSQSLSFLKGLMKEMGQTDSKYEKMEVMRERVRTFVNPELKMREKTDEVRKALFGRSRGISQMLKLK